MALPRGDEGRHPKALKNDNKSALLRRLCYHALLPLGKQRTLTSLCADLVIPDISDTLNENHFDTSLATSFESGFKMLLIPTPTGYVV